MELKGQNGNFFRYVLLDDPLMMPAGVDSCIHSASFYVVRGGSLSLYCKLGRTARKRLGNTDRVP